MNDNTGGLNEAEIQFLIVLIELQEPIETPNNNHYSFYPKTIEEAAAYFRNLRQDWTSAETSLSLKGLIKPAAGRPRLTDLGRSAAVALPQSRPPIYYWYQDCYAATGQSPAFDEYCQRLFGRPLCQTGFCDMGQLDQLIESLRLTPKSRVLDLGCSKGMIAEYFSDITGAQFTGIDYSTEAIRQAIERTRAKRSRLDFQVQNMDDLQFPKSSFDAVISIDTLYMPTDLEKTLRKVVDLLKPGGQIAAFYSTMVFDEDRSKLLAENTPLGLGLTKIGLPFTTIDFSEQNYYHLQRKRQIAIEMKNNFEMEGHLDLWQNIMMESESSQSVYDPATYHTTRYLYQVVLP